MYLFCISPSEIIFKLLLHVLFNRMQSSLCFFCKILSLCSLVHIIAPTPHPQSYLHEKPLSMVHLKISKINRVLLILGLLHGLAWSKCGRCVKKRNLGQTIANGISFNFAFCSFPTPYITCPSSHKVFMIFQTGYLVFWPAVQMKGIGF